MGRCMTCLLLGAVGCGRGGAGSAVRSTVGPRGESAVSERWLSVEKYGVRMLAPPGWSQIDSRDYAIALVPAGATVPVISLDIPWIPVHLPGMINMPRVENGYLDDLKKQHPGVETSGKDQAIPGGGGGAARRIESAWDSGSARRREIAVLIIHKDQVYILRLEGSNEQAEANLKPFDRVMQSMLWK